MSKGIGIAVAVVLVVLLLLYMSTYTVRFHEVAVKTRYFGGASEREVAADPGLHFKMPLFTDVTTLDTRLRLVETPKIEVATADDQSIVIEAFLMWKVDTREDAPLRFAEAFEAIDDADRKLNGDLRTALTTTLGKYGFDDLIGPESRLPEAEAAILAQLSFLNGLGVEPVLAGISQVLLPTRTTTAVLDRMEEVRKSLAARERARGESEAMGIQAAANTTAEKLLAFASQRGEEIRAGANAVVANSFAQLKEDEPLAIFLLQLDALEQSLREQTTIFMSDQSAPWHHLNLEGFGEMRGLPQPGGGTGPAPGRVTPDGQER